MAKRVNPKCKDVVVGRKASLDEHAAYVLITCGTPSKDGKMQVEMTYEGDPMLTSYLLANAQQFIDND